MKLPNLTQIIESVVIFIAAGSFIISYNNLHESALLMGIPPLMAIIFPLTIDAFLIICTLFVLYAGRMCKPVWEGWLFLVLYTIASIAFNIHMAPDDWWSRAGFAMCPIGLCIALHFLMRIFEIEMGGCKPEIVEDHIKIPEPILQPYHEVESPFKSEPCDLSGIKIEPEPELTEQQKKVLDVFKSESDISMAEAGRRLDMSYKTVKKYKDQLIEMGML